MGSWQVLLDNKEAQHRRVGVPYTVYCTGLIQASALGVVAQSELPSARASSSSILAVTCAAVVARVARSDESAVVGSALQELEKL